VFCQESSGPSPGGRKWLVQWQSSRCYSKTTYHCKLCFSSKQWARRCAREPNGFDTFTGKRSRFASATHLMGCAPCQTSRRVPSPAHQAHCLASDNATGT
jgi:hypothetical protein